jgi:hypothetical protein
MRYNGGRVYEDDLELWQDGHLFRTVPSALASVHDRSRVLLGTTSIDRSSTYLLVLPDRGADTRLEMIRLNLAENRLVWRRQLKAPLDRQSERIAANARGVGYWSSLKSPKDDGTADIWFEFLEAE